MSHSDSIGCVHLFREEVARLEFALDEALCVMIEKFPTQIPRKVPAQYTKKVDFLYEFFRINPSIRRFGSGFPWHNLNGLGYMLEELFEKRNHLTHGVLRSTWAEDGELVFFFERLIKDKESTSGVRNKKYKTTRKIISIYSKIARNLTIYLEDLKKYLNDEISMNFYAERSKSQANQRDWWLTKGQFDQKRLLNGSDGILCLLRGDFA